MTDFEFWIVELILCKLGEWTVRFWLLIHFRNILILLRRGDRFSWNWHFLLFIFSLFFLLIDFLFSSLQLCHLKLPRSNANLVVIIISGLRIELLKQIFEVSFESFSIMNVLFISSIEKKTVTYDKLNVFDNIRKIEIFMLLEFFDECSQIHRIFNYIIVLWNLHSNCINRVSKGPWRRDFKKIIQKLNPLFTVYLTVLLGFIFFLGKLLNLTSKLIHSCILFLGQRFFLVLLAKVSLLAWAFFFLSEKRGCFHSTSLSLIQERLIYNGTTFTIFLKW